MTESQIGVTDTNRLRIMVAAFAGACNLAMVGALCVSGDSLETGAPERRPEISGEELPDGMSSELFVEACRIIYRWEDQGEAASELAFDLFHLFNGCKIAKPL